MSKNNFNAKGFIFTFVEADFQFEDFDSEQLVVLEKQIATLGIELEDELNEKEFYRVKRIICDMHESYMEEDTMLGIDFDANMEDETMKETNTTNATVNNANMEDETMRTMNNETAATNEATMGEKAKAFAEASKEKLAKGFEFVTENVESVADEVKKMANMNESQLEDYLKDNGKNVLDDIIKGIKCFASKARKDGEENSFFRDVLNEDADKAESVVQLIKEVLDEDELSGWGKFKAIVKELIKWVLRLLLKVGAIVLKIAITVTVGVIKLGATALVTAGKVVGVINKEVVKPSIKAGKTTWSNYKAAKEAKKEADEYEEVRESLFGVDEN